MAARRANALICVAIGDGTTSHSKIRYICTFIKYITIFMTKFIYSMRAY